VKTLGWALNLATQTLLSGSIAGAASFNKSVTNECQSIAKIL